MSLLFCPELLQTRCLIFSVFLSRIPRDPPPPIPPNYHHSQHCFSNICLLSPLRQAQKQKHKNHPLASPPPSRLPPSSQAEGKKPSPRLLVGDGLLQEGHLRLQRLGALLVVHRRGRLLALFARAFAGLAAARARRRGGGGVVSGGRGGGGKFGAPVFLLEGILKMSLQRVSRVLFPLPQVVSGSPQNAIPHFRGPAQQKIW